MAHVVVTIAGRTYRMGCEDGEEARLHELAKRVEAKIVSLKEGFGDIGDQRIVVMAALTLADEADTADARLRAAEAELAAAQRREAGLLEAEAALQEKVADALEETANRVERLVADLRSGGEEPGPIP
ncbi:MULTISPECIES: cell division protein ZapA [Methylosinus]|uniref:Cell division protein ZapA n=1 Tax=Methylosinus trichosporium (strain ATCC 35070 / NCIMB 11131 / UNIQEM 75 / OB3b) TaxID=595536 RepID=A0A2D2D0I5_METT3|nr:MULTISPECIES: cell division protein ZapA [Methylosinus]ATQ68503.1 cell division protein ZapA [Methylosinus trichosporium OB3b]OBS53965.1 cell division protein ZapA [Methylosinus sp. 3S-1]